MKVMITKDELRSSNELLSDYQGKKKEETQASRKLVRALSTFLEHKHPSSHNEPFLRMSGKGRFVHAHSFAVAVSKMVTKMLRRHE